MPEGGELLDAAREALERSKPYSEGFDLEVIEATSEVVESTATPVVSAEQENESVCGTALARTNADAFAGPSTTLSADTDGRPVGCSPLALLRGRSLADAFEVPVEAD